MIADPDLLPLEDSPSLETVRQSGSRAFTSSYSTPSPSEEEEERFLDVDKFSFLVSALKESNSSEDLQVQIECQTVDLCQVIGWVCDIDPPLSKG